MLSGVNFMGAKSPIFVPFVQVLFGYEFLDSGWNKLFAKQSFPAGLGAYLGGMLQGRSGWYDNFVYNVVIPHAVLFGYLVEWGEFLTGLVIIAGGVFFLAGKSSTASRYRFFAVLSVAALLGTIFLTVNFWLATGALSPLPGLNRPDGVGVSIDVFASLLAVVLVWWNIAGLRATLSVNSGSPRVIELRGYRLKRTGGPTDGSRIRPRRGHVPKAGRSAAGPSGEHPKISE
jgi:uncharacterized membrane protein YphA (DoxX/SURF4 family)